MRVIVQDLDTGTYLAVDGRWVATEAQAKDFFTLMRAYHYARVNTSRRFKVLLHCPDDDYCAVIIAGIGIAAPELSAADAGSGAKPVLFSRTGEIAQRPARYACANRFDRSRNHLN